MGTLLALSPLLIRVLKLLAPVLVGLLLLPVLIAAAVLNKSTVVWPVAAPTAVSAAQADYTATGWTISSPFGWRPVPTDPSQWELHEGVDLAGPMFCNGCAIPPMGDIEVSRVDWEQPYATDPRIVGAGVVVDMELQHPEESGAFLIRYGHLQSYSVSVRTQSCTQQIDCPVYADDAVGSVQVTCRSTVVEEPGGDATRRFVYAKPGQCQASVVWPDDLVPDGPTDIEFDQQITEGQSSSNAAITFRAQYPPPPTSTLTLTPTLTPDPTVPTATPVPAALQRKVPTFSLLSETQQDGTPTPTVDPATPCLKAALLAATRQGARYSQGGALAADPINPATGQPYPRTGPNSFDCSGLVWWAYQQAGVNIGTSTASQINNGVAISCTLTNLNGTSTTCWAPGDLIFLRYGGAGTGPGAGSRQHVAIYVGNGLFMDCYNHATNCILHDVARDSFYRRYFWQAQRIVSGCEGLTIDPGVPVDGPLGEPTGDSLCIADPPNWTDTPDVGYSRGCGPPVLPPSPQRQNGTRLRQFVGTVGWLGQTGAMTPPGAAGVHLHLGLDIGTNSDMCRWPLQVPGVGEGEPPPGAYWCQTSWADPLQFLPQANPDTLAMVNGTAAPVASGGGDPTLDGALLQLPPPGHPATTLLPPDSDKPDGTWWSPGNDDRATKVDGALGGPAILDWLTWLWCLLFGGLPWAGCGV